MGSGKLAEALAATESVALDRPAKPVLALPYWLVPCVLAAFFALWGLRGVTSTGVVDTDAVRHAMNGVLVHDFIYDSLHAHKWIDPVGYARQYYARLPALSLPYHPPLFPAFESVFFFVLGVNVLAARLAIAMAVALCAFLFYQLIMATHGSSTLAAVCTVSFLSLRVSQWVSSDVMLEFPAMVFVLWSLYYLRELHEGYSLRRGLGFALVAGAAVWTKQHAVFLGLLPFAYIVFFGRWRLLLDKTIWISSALFGAIVLPITILLPKFVGMAANKSVRPSGTAGIFSRNLRFYIQNFPGALGLPLTVVLAIAVIGFGLGLWRRGRVTSANRLYIAWASAAFLVLLVIVPLDERYLFFVHPPVIVLGYAGLFRLCAWVLPNARVWYIPGGMAVLSFVLGLNAPVTFLRGPQEAASIVASASPERILYCGGTDGNFIFALRSVQSHTSTAVIRGDKVAGSTFSPGRLEAFAHRYGVNYIVLERSGSAKPWDSIYDAPPPSMVWQREIAMASSDRRWNGSLRIYRFTNPSATPDTLDVPINMIIDRPASLER